MDAIKRGDAAEAVFNFAEGARVLWPNTEIITGKQAIQAGIQRLIDNGWKEVHLEIVELEPLGDKAVYEIGKMVSKVEREPGVLVEYVGKYVCIWKHDGESWKIDVDITNSSLPAS
jgi:ketosteroid isomerase-like protein